MPKIVSLAHAAEAVEATLSDPPSPEGRWSWAQVLVHCAQSIECSLNGFPKLKPRFIRATVGKMVARRFLSRGRLSHDTTGSIPGVNDPAGLDLVGAWSRLVQAIADFEAHQGPLRPHFMFGDVDKAEYGRLHALHIQDHLRSVGR